MASAARRGQPRAEDPQGASCGEAPIGEAKARRAPTGGGAESPREGMREETGPEYSSSPLRIADGR